LRYTGTLSVWTPKLDAPVTLSSGYVPRSATTASHPVILFLDTPQPNQAAPGQVKLLRTGECTGATCPVQTLAAGVTLTATRMSLDGRYAQFDTQTVTGSGEVHSAFLVSVADGTTSQVGTTTIPPQVPYQELAALAPDGSLVATITTVQGNALQLQVISTATGAPMPWGTPPAGMLCTSVQFADPATLFVEVLDGQGNASVYRTTATGASPFANATQFFLFQAPPGAERYFFFSTTAMAALAAQAPFDLQMVDLAAANATPIPLAQSTLTVPILSDDLSSLWVLDRYDVATGNGTLIEASLPSGRLTTVASSVNVDSINFASGTNDLFYDTPPYMPSGVPNAVVAPLIVFSGGKSEVIDPDVIRWNSAPSPPTLYVTADNPLRIYREPEP
jgi:hypothetical protein